MQNAMPKTYYSLIIDFNAPINRRYSIFSMPESQIKNYYDNKAVADYFRRFEQIFRKYSDFRTLKTSLNKSGVVTFSDNTPNVLFSNPYNPDENLFLAIAIEKDQILNLVAKFGL